MIDLYQQINWLFSTALNEQHSTFVLTQTVLSLNNVIDNQWMILMVSFSNGVINEIKRASTETELKTIVENSFSQLKEKQIFNESGYIMNMIVSLRSINTEGLSPEIIHNVNVGIVLFREYRRKREQLFWQCTGDGMTH